MTSSRKVLVTGATGLVGSAVVRHLSAAGCEVVAVARRTLPPLPGVTNVAADLRDERACADLFGAMGDITHLVYTALYEQADLVSGWTDTEQIAINDRMLRNVLDPLATAALNLSHVTLLQGTKAYGVHVRPIPTPAREDRDEWRAAPNFYWEQEDYLRASGASAPWNWTIVRPTLIVGGGVGGAMNMLPALGVFAALCRASGEPCGYSGGGPRIGNAVDVDLLARAIDWAGCTEAARNEVFNVTNGDVYVWEALWPALADAFGVDAGPAQPHSIEAYCRPRAEQWDQIRREHDLVSPDLQSFVGPSLQYCDYQMRHGHPKPGRPGIVSTIKLHSAGFHEVMDTEDMFRKWVAHLQAQRLLPRY